MQAMLHGPCNFLYFNFNPLKQIHRTEKAFICPTCSKAFKTNCALVAHQQWHLDYDARSLECEYCDKKFFRKIALVEHLRVHTGERPFKCDQCDYAATTDGNLRKHKNNKHKKLP